MQFIKYNDHKFKVIEYSGPLFRADILQQNDYKNASIKFFTLTHKETSPYSKNARYIKTWETDKPLILLDILDMNTYKSLSAVIGQQALTNAFPIKNGKVNRFSNVKNNGTNPDYEVLHEICKLGFVDGYYMDATSNFHSEIGLCRRGLNKLTYIKYNISEYQPPRVTKAKRSFTRRFISSDSESKSNDKNVFRGSLFGGKTYKSRRVTRKRRV